MSRQDLHESSAHCQCGKLEFGGESPLTMRYGLRVDIPHPLGPSTGGQWPRTIRYGRWVVIVHPLGPSTWTAQKSSKLSFSVPMPSPGGKVPPKGADEERRQLTTRSAVKLRAYSLQNSTFFTNCVYSRYISPLLISLASLDSFPPGEAMGAPAPVQLCSPFAE